GITLGSLIGISSFLQLSRRSTTTTMEEPPSSNNIRKNHHKLMKPYWLFSLCSKLNTDAVIVHSDADAPSLGLYLEAERRTARNNQRRNQCQEIYVPNDFDTIQYSNSLFHGDQVAAVQSPDSLDEEEEATREWEQSNNRFGVKTFLPPTRVMNKYKGDAVSRHINHLNIMNTILYNFNIMNTILYNLIKKRRGGTNSWCPKCGQLDIRLQRFKHTIQEFSSPTVSRDLTDDPSDKAKKMNSNLILDEAIPQKV
ncbi:hypothetical protein PIB30_105523, partial [Stylosanthes scabra]|nr:hypothetical protein [Stylosanthes scabra]